MSTTRMLVKHGDTVYRFLRFDARPDVSLLLFLDRDPSPPTEARTLSATENRFVSSSQAEINTPLPHAKISCHTTGEIRYYEGGILQTTFHTDPLFKLANRQTIAFFSIPRPRRLDTYDSAQHASDALATLDVPQEIDERMTFAIDSAPASTELPITYGIALKYEAYSVGVRLLPAPPVAIPSDLRDHFLHGVLRPDKSTSRAIDKATAELEFHRTVHGTGPIIFRSSDAQL
jgi:hypothetical protein